MRQIAIALRSVRDSYKKATPDLGLLNSEFPFGMQAGLCHTCMRPPHPGGEGEPALLMVCGDCHRAQYCSRACQRLDWTDGWHKTACKKKISSPSQVETEKEEGKDV